MGGSLEEPETSDKEGGKILRFLKSGRVGLVKFWSYMLNLESTSSTHWEVGYCLGSPRDSHPWSTPPLWIGLNCGQVTSPETIM